MNGFNTQHMDDIEIDDAMTSYNYNSVVVC